MPLMRSFNFKKCVSLRYLPHLDSSAFCQKKFVTFFAKHLCELLEFKKNSAFEILLIYS